MKKNTAAAVVSAVLILIAVIVGRASALPEQSVGNPYVCDGANVLSKDAERQIYDLNKNADGRRYVVTVNGTGKYGLVRFANKLAKEWKISSRTDALIVLDIKNKDYYAVWGGNLNDSQMQGILDGGVESAFVRHDYDGAAKAFCTGTIEQHDYYSEFGYYYDIAPAYVDEGDGFISLILLIIIIAVIVTVIKTFARAMHGVSTRGAFGGGRVYIVPPLWMRYTAPRRPFSPPPPPHRPSGSSFTGIHGGFGTSGRSSGFGSARSSGFSGGGFHGGGRSGGGFHGGGRSGGGFHGGGRGR